MAKPLWAGLDIGVETTTVCIINDAGEVVHNSTCATSLKAICRELTPLRRRKYATVGMEAATGMYIARGLRNFGYEIQLYEQRQLSKFLRLRRNKTDEGDALGIADAGRLGAATVARVHLKSLECQCLQSRLTIRRQLIAQRVAAVNILGRQLELYGGRMHGSKSHRLRATVERELKKVFGRAPSVLKSDLLHLLSHCEGLMEHQQCLDKELSISAAENEVCRRFMEIPGVGPLCALTFFATIADPNRFRRSADVGSYLGLTPTISQSGLTSRIGRISKMGNKAARTLLVTSSGRLLCSSRAKSDLKSWVAKLEQRSGRKKARVALARKLATVMLAMWKSGESYKPTAASVGR